MKSPKNEPSYACWSGFRDPQVAGAIARQPFDAIVLDAQHGFHDDGSLLACIKEVLSAGKSPIVRLPLNRWDLCEKVLDYGALGVAAPMINTKADAQAFARSANYPSVGQRSYAPRYAADTFGLDTGAYQRATLDCTFAFAQIETHELVKDVAQRTLAAGKIPTCFTNSVEHANLCAGFGYKLISITMDGSIISAGAAKSFEGLNK